MCDFSVDLNDLPDHDVDVRGDFDAELAAVMPLAREELVLLDGKRITVTEKGRPFVRLVAAAFDAYLAKARARHSAAV